MRVLLSVLFGLLLLKPVHADGVAPVVSPVVMSTQIGPPHSFIESVEPEEPPPETVMLDVVVEPTERLTSKILFLIDVSGSMKGEPLGRALGMVAEVVEQPLDDLEIGIISFADATNRWPGYRGPKDEDLPDGWGRLPSAQTLASAKAWIQSWRGGGGTDPLGAIATAINENRKDLSVVLVTDGDFPAETALAAFRGSLKAREAAGLGRVVFMVLGVGSASPKQSHMVDMAREGGGGYFIQEKR